MIDRTPPTRSDRDAIPVVWLDEVDSTMREARRRIELNTASAPFALAARRQTAGYGRRGGEWHSPAGGLWMTCAWPEELIVHVDAAGLLLASACREAVADLLASHGGDAHAAALKPPNDVLIAGMKVAGLIAERLHHRRRPWLLVGVGMNVNNDPADLPPGLRLPPTALSRHAPRPVDLAHAASRVVEHLTRALLSRREQ